MAVRLSKTYIDRCEGSPRCLMVRLHEYENFYNPHQPHQGITNTRPLHPLPQPTTDQASIAQLTILRYQRLGGILNEYHHAT